MNYRLKIYLQRKMIGNVSREEKWLVIYLERKNYCSKNKKCKQKEEDSP